jgi:hypothetical protein
MPKGLASEAEEANRLEDDDDAGTGEGAEKTRKPTKGKHVQDWTVARLGRFTRPKGPDIPPLSSLQGLWPRFDRSYDRYYDGPTSEVLKRWQPIDLADANLVYFANRIVTPPWREFIDYGWRLLQTSFSMFHHRPPILVKEHLMPVGLHNPPPFDNQHTAASGHADGVEVGDVQVMSPSEMLDVARRDRTNDIFLTGHTKDKKYVCVDIEGDAVVPESTEVTWDIDSVIWLTRKPRFKMATNVYTTPQIRDRAPIWKHNHIYVDLLVPESQEGRDAEGIRSEWWEKRFRLSQLPHIHFGKLGDGSGLISLYLFFPRMAHQHESMRRWMSMVPMDVQRLFWDRVVCPSIVKVTASSFIFKYPTLIDEFYYSLNRQALLNLTYRQAKIKLSLRMGGGKPRMGNE